MAEGVVIQSCDLNSDKSVSELTADSGTKAKLPPAILIVVGEILTRQHAQAVIDRICRVLSSCDASTTQCDISAIIGSLSSHQPVVNIESTADKVLQWISDAIHIEVLINPSIKSARDCINRFLSATGDYRCLLYAGHTIAGNGNWLLRDGSLSFGALAELFRVGYDASGLIEIATFVEGEWTLASVGKLSPSGKVRMMAVKSGEVDVSDGIKLLTSCINEHIIVKSVSEMMTISGTVGVVPFHRPTMYLFQGGDGVCAVFGIRGFVLLVDGGYAKHTACWEFIRHIDRIDAMLISHIGVDTAMGTSSLLERLSLGDVLTTFGVVYFNTSQSTLSDTLSSSPLQLSPSSVASEAVDRIHKMGIPVMPCTAHASGQPVNLYHKIGFGTLDMYVMNPVAESKEFKELMASANKSPGAVLNAVNQACIVCVVVFKPHGNDQKPVRILFPGSLSQSKLFEGLDRLKNVAIFQFASGVGKPPAAQKGAEKASTRPATVAGDKTSRSATAQHSPMTTTQRPATTGTARVKPTPTATTDGEMKDAKKPVASSAEIQKKDKKPSNIDARKPAESKPQSAVAVKKVSDSKPSATSTPKKDTPRPTTQKGDSAKKSGTPVSGKKTDDGSKKGVADKSKQAANKQVNSASDVIVTVEKSNKETPQEAPLETPQEAPLETPQEAPFSTETLKVDDIVVESADSEVKPEKGESSETNEPSLTTEVCQAGDSGNTDDQHTEVIDSNGQQVDEIAGIPPPELDPIRDWDVPQNVPPPADDQNDTTSDPAASSVLTDYGSVKQATGDKMAVTNQLNEAVNPVDPKSASDTTKNTTAENGGTKKQKQLTDSKQAKAATKPNPSKSDPSKSSTPHPSSATAIKKSVQAPLKPVIPFHVDLTYIPVDAAKTCDADFFRRVQARRYVLPGAEANTQVLQLLVDGKASWEGEVSVIPTGNVDGLREWLESHREQLLSHHIVVEPSVADCTMSLEQAGTCTAFRLEL